MRRDPIVEQVRRVRRKIEAACGNDEERYFRLIKEGEAALGSRLVRFGPRPALRRRKAS